MSKLEPDRGAILTALLWASCAGAVLLVLVRWVDSTVGIVVAKSLVRVVREHRVDVLVLLEITPVAVEHLRLAGLDSPLPESAGRASQDAWGTIVRSRGPMTSMDSPPDQSLPHGLGEPVVSIHRSTGAVTLRSIHARPPGLSGAAEWRAGLAERQVWRERQPSGLATRGAGG